MIAQKRHVRVTLDIMCYDDLDVRNINWRELLELEGDEEVDPTIREIDPFGCMCQFSCWHIRLICVIFYGRGSGDVLSSTGIPFPSSDCDHRIAQHPDDLGTLVPLSELAQCCLKAPGIGFMLDSFNTKPPMIFLTYPDHGCVYTLSQEDGDELYYAPIYADGTVNLEEFAPVDLDSVDMDEMEIFDIRNRLSALCQM